MKKILCSALAVSLVISGAVIANAADIINREAQLRPDFTIVIDDEVSYFKSADGKYIYPILYNDSTYLPLRSIGEIIGKNVNWDESTKTITLSGKRDSYKNTTKPSSAKITDIDVQERRDFTIILEGEECNFKDANGKAVYPLLYNGSTYLPLRAISEITGNEVIWDGDDKVITLKDEESTVTDADTFGPTENDIGIEKAKEIALDDAGYKAADVKFTRAEKDYNNNKDIWVYEVEFTSGKWEYEYEIELETGDILTQDRYYNSDYDEADDKISIERARQMALDHAGIKGSGVKYIKTELNGEKYYIEFTHGGYNYEYEIDSYTGSVINFKSEKGNSGIGIGSDKPKYLTNNEALEAVLKHAGINMPDAFEVKVELDDGKYEVEFKAGRYEYEAEVDMYTGKVFDYKREWND